MPHDEAPPVHTMDTAFLASRSYGEWTAYTLFALVPGLLWLYFFYRKDRYEPEPRALVLKVFAFGGLMVPLAASIQWLGRDFVLRGLSLAPEPMHSLRLLAFAFVVVALSEEVLKYLVVRLRMMPDPEFDEPMDGIIYAVSCGLGFATAENVLYMFQYGAEVLIIRMLFSVFLHAGCSGLCGYYLGRAKFEPSRSLRHQAVGVVLATAIHGLYDFLVFKRFFWGLAAIIVLLAWVKSFLDTRVQDALDHSPFKNAPKDQ